ncbi:MAG: gliding motility protein GldN [Bacteroidales bacterium]|nr:gliding motility protein GldN [Bacteroidales bacterium]
MNSLRNILLVCLVPLFANVSAQVKRVATQNNQAASASEELTVRAQSFYSVSALDVPNAQWSRVVYRELSLTDGSNASLYYPEDAVEGQPNLFRLIINLLADNKIKGYEYIGDREQFSPKYELKVKDMFDKFHIVYKENASRSSNAPSSFVVDENDIPANEVLSYYIKERWVFDQQGSKFFSKVDAICPILHRNGDFGGEEVKYPMMWIKYDDIKPYLNQYHIMSDGTNNVMRYTFNDFFVLRQYKGEIYKTLNLQNKTLRQLYPDDDSLKIAREKIENELKMFEKGLWVPKPAVDSTLVDSKKEKQDKSITRSSKRSNPRDTSSQVKSSSSSSDSKSAPVRSVRRSR